MATQTSHLGFAALLASTALVLDAPAFAVPVTISGSFTTTTPACGTASVSCTGVGTSLLNWGVPAPGTVLPSSLFFEARTGLDSSEIVNGAPVVLGNLRYVNGTAQAGTWIDALNLRIDVTGGRVEALDVPITAVNTLCVGTEPPDFCADYIYFTDATSLGSFRTWEGFYAVATLVGVFGSLNLGGFGDVTAVGFADVFTGQLGDPIDPDLLPPNLQAGFLNPSVTAIPEPSTLALLGGALLMLAGCGVTRRTRLEA